ncbi:hypothetical protein MJH12_11260, partial [bacterium]|nr:hypothetical protein [bacterium]
QAEHLEIFLKSVEYQGVKYSEAQSQKVTVEGVETFSNFGNQDSVFNVPAANPLFTVRMIDNETGEIELGAVDEAAVESAIFHFVIRDRDNVAGALESAEDTSCVLRVRDNGTPKISSEPSEIAAAIGPINEDSTVSIDMGVFEASNYNFFGGPLDSDLRWSVKLTSGLTLFNNDVAYPDFKEYLMERNIQSKVNCLTNLSGSDRAISTLCNELTIDGTPVDLAGNDFSNDTLYIHPAPDVHGDFTLEFTLNNVSCASGISCTVTTSVDLTILPVLDPPEITIRKLNEVKTDDSNYVIQLPDDSSVMKIDITSWENYSRDFIKPVTGNPVGQFWNDNPFLQSNDTAIYHLGHGSCNTYFEDYSNNDNLCMFADVNASVTGGSSSIDLVLHNGSFEVTRNINIDVGLKNRAPSIVFLENGISVVEDTATNKDLTPHGDDREDELAGVEHLMTWFFGTNLPALQDREFPISEMTARVGPTSILTQTALFTNITLDQATNVVSLLPIENATGVESLVLVLCDTDSGAVGEKICITTDIRLEITAVDDIPILSDIVTTSMFQTFFETDEGLCMSIDLSTIVSDIENDSMDYVLLSTSIIDFDTSIFDYPIVTIENNFLNLRPFGYDQSCTQMPNLTRSTRAYGIVSFVLKIQEQGDNTKSVQFHHQVTWLDFSMAPEICPIGQSPVDTLCRLNGSFGDGNSSFVEYKALEDQVSVLWSLEKHESETSDWVMQDQDWKYGETINDYSWAFLSSGNQRILTYETSAFVLEIVTGTIDVKDYIRFSVKENMYTTTLVSSAPTDIVTLSVIDSTGLSASHEIRVSVLEVNDDPVWFDTSFDTHIKPTEEDLYGPIALFNLANDQFDPNPLLTFRMVEFDKTGQVSQCDQAGTTNTDDGLIPIYDKFLATIDVSGNFFLTGKLNRNHFEEDYSVATFDIVTFQVTDVNNGCIFKEFKVELQQLDDIPILVKPAANLSHSYVLSEGGSSVSTEIEANDAIDYNLTWDSTRDAPGILDGYLTFTVNRLDGTIDSSAYLINPNHISDPKELVIALKDSDVFTPGTEQWELVLNQSSSTKYGFGRAKSNVTTKMNFSVSMIEVNDPPIMSILGNSLCIPGAATGQTLCTISSLEDTAFPATQLTSLGFAVSDEESGTGATLVNHVYSFSPTAVLTQIVKTASRVTNNNQMQFTLIDHTSVNSNAQLQADLLTPCVDNQKCDNHGTFDQEIYVLEVQGGVVQLFSVETKLRFSYVMQSVNDSPYFENTLFPNIVKQNDGVFNQVHGPIDISAWKADVDASSTDVCYSLPLLHQNSQRV